MPEGGVRGELGCGKMERASYLSNSRLSEKHQLHAAAWFRSVRSG